MKRIRMTALLSATLLLLAGPVSAQHEQHAAGAARPAGQEPARPMMSEMSVDPIHGALMDLVAIPGLAEQLALTPVQIDAIAGLSRPVFDQAATVADLPSLGPDPTSSEIREYLRNRSDAVGAAYAASVAVREVLSAAQRQTLAGLDPSARHMAAMNSDHHAAIMRLIGSQGCGMKMESAGGMMQGMQGMMHGEQGAMQGHQGMQGMMQGDQNAPRGSSCAAMHGRTQGGDR